MHYLVYSQVTHLLITTHVKHVSDLFRTPGLAGTIERHSLNGTPEEVVPVLNVFLMKLNFKDFLEYCSYQPVYGKYLFLSFFNYSSFLDFSGVMH